VQRKNEEENNVGKEKVFAWIFLPFLCGLKLKAKLRLNNDY
jgi:hypothetical protein